jgi:hypothetical protein
VFADAWAICVEVLSPRNSEEEVELRKRLLFEKGAIEFWLCGLMGDMTFFNVAASMPASKLCPDFPAPVEI